MRKAVFNWSGGKDSALALHHTLQNEEYEVQKLITNVSTQYNRISMHGVRSALLKEQTKAIGLPLQEIFLPEKPTMQGFEEVLEKSNRAFKKQGIDYSIFGDIFLEDLKKYRDVELAKTGIKGHYPLWKRNTTELLHEFIDLGFKTILVCIDSKVMPKEFVGRSIDLDFIKDLPANVDPCGENGEFHTFVYDGPIFKYPLPIELGSIVRKEYDAPKTMDNIDSVKPNLGFYFQDIHLSGH